MKITVRKGDAVIEIEVSREEIALPEMARVLREVISVAGNFCGEGEGEGRSAGASS